MKCRRRPNPKLTLEYLQEQLINVRMGMWIVCVAFIIALTVGITVSFNRSSSARVHADHVVEAALLQQCVQTQQGWDVQHQSIIIDHEALPLDGLAGDLRRARIQGNVHRADQQKLLLKLAKKRPVCPGDPHPPTTTTTVVRAAP